MKTFADFLQDNIEKNSSRIVAGFDPIIESFPQFLLDEVHKSTATNADAIEKVLTLFYSTALEEVRSGVAAIKPNTAFFEQYGIPGLKALENICQSIKAHNLPIIADAKRGDIGSTAKAYSSAFLSKAKAFGKNVSLIEADALTVNPFLGFDTVEVFLQDCINHGKGLFILVKTSNPGSAAIQGFKNSQGGTVSEHIADWIGENSSKLKGNCGFSGLGAVVGATYPEEARILRKRMPDSFFLIPGMGAQGGSASDALAGFAVDNNKNYSAGVVNISRGLFSDLPKEISNIGELRIIFRARLEHFNNQVREALQIIS